jgi:hypothetical protein
LSALHDLQIPAIESETLRKSAEGNRQPAFTFDGGQLPFDRVPPDLFELLVSDLYRYKHGEPDWSWYDTSFRLNGGADMGQDVVLMKDGNPAGVVQCKRIKKNMNLEDMLGEMCKFFLFAYLNPILLSSEETDFRYFFAVSASVQNEGFRFFQSSGAQRFIDNRSLIEDVLVGLVKKYASFRTSLKLKGLAKADLCDLIWNRLIVCKTKVYRQEELSDFVRGCAEVRDTYFGLQHVAVMGAEAAELILKYLRKSGAPSSVSDVLNAINSYTVEVPTAAIDDDKINLCMLQGDGDFVLESLRKLLSPAAGILTENIGGKPVVIVGGSECLKLTDRKFVDDIIRAYPSSVVFIAGCGDVTGEELLLERGNEQNTWIYRGLAPAPRRKYRAGWCWVKTNIADEIDPYDKTSCYPLVVNSPLDPVFDGANLGLKIAFQDLVIYPVLDDDIYSGWKSSKSLLKRVSLGVQDDPLVRRTLICAALNVKDVDSRLENTISDLLAFERTIEANIALVVSNSSITTRQNSLWRSASGVFPSSDESGYFFRQEHSPKGLIVRRDDSALVLIVAKWEDSCLIPILEYPFYMTGGDVEVDVESTELELFYHMKWNPPHGDSHDQLVSSFCQFRERLNNKNYKWSGELTAGFIEGVNYKAAFKSIDIQQAGERLCQPLQAACYLSGVRGAEWVSSDEYISHIDYGTPARGKVSLFVWANRRVSINQVHSDLIQAARKGGASPDLVVFTSVIGDPGPDGTLPVPMPRQDIANSLAIQGSITEPGITRKSFIFPLNEIEATYMKPVSAVDARETYLQSILERKDKLDV